MSLGKQARILSKGQVEAVLGYIAKTRYPARNRVIFLLSAKAGLRAKEIASLTWEMVSDGRQGVGTAIHLPNAASKGRSGRIIPMNRELIDALQVLKDSAQLHELPFVVRTERSVKTSPQAVVNLFARWYDELGFQGCSSHSGRRTFITNAARKISTVGGSVRDVQILAGHTNMRTTQRYIEADAEAQRKIVELV
jgi:integrase